MSKKQDRTSPRTPADLERRYNFGRSFAELEGIALDAQTHAYKAEEAIKQWSQHVESDLGDVYAELDMRVEKDENDNLVGKIHIGANQLTIDTDNFKLDEDGNVELKGRISARRGYIGLWDIYDKGIYKNTNSHMVVIDAPEAADDDFITVSTLENYEVTDVTLCIKGNGNIFTRGIIQSSNADASQVTTIENGGITTNAGHIGDWEISEGRLYALEIADVETRETIIAPNNIRTKWMNAEQTRIATLEGGLLNVELIGTGLAMPSFANFNFNGTQYALYVDTANGNILKAQEWGLIE